MTTNRVPVLSLFCGCGGFDLGFRNAGFETVLAIDNDRAATETYNHNHPRRAISRNLEQLSVPELIRILDRKADHYPKGLIGGPPCQAFSIGNVSGQSEHPTAHLIHRYARIVKGLNALRGLDFFIFENVVGLTSRRHQPQFDKLIRSLEQAGFCLFSDCLDAKDFGVPQRRPRRFIVGINADRFPSISFSFPQPSTKEPATVREAIGGLPEPVLFERNLSGIPFPAHPNHWAMRPRSAKFTNGFIGNGEKSGRSFRLLKWDKPSFAVAYGHREVHVHPEGHRRLSVYEAMLLQGFPSTYELLGTLSDQIRLISNAVPPPVASALAKAIFRSLYRQSAPGKARAQRPSR